MNIIQKTRQQLARDMANALDLDPYLVDELHAEMAARSMAPLLEPGYQSDAEDVTSGPFKGLLEAEGLVAVEEEDLARLEVTITEFAEDEDLDIVTLDQLTEHAKDLAAAFDKLQN